MRPRIKLLGTALVAAALTALAAIAAPTPASAATLTEVTQLRHQPQQPPDVPVRAEQRRGPTGPARGGALLHRLRPGVLLRHRVRLARRPVRLHRHLPVGHPQRQLLRRLVAAGAHATTAAATRWASCRWSTTSSSTTTATPSRVYATGTSSGAMMTNVLLGDYPDVFKAGAAFIGRAVRLLRHHRRLGVEQRLRQRPASPRPRSSGATWSATPTPATPARGRACRCGTAPTTTTLRYPNFGEEIKQWTNVLGREPDADLHRHPAVRLDPHPLRRHRRHGAGRGDQHPGRRRTPCR